ncbi:hypothetical protein EBR25_01260 [bacterium]|nr:hypothetical protein [bacterium]
MADEEQETEEQENGEAQEGKSDSGKKRFVPSRKVLLIALGVVVVVAAIGTPLAFFLLRDSEETEITDLDKDAAKDEPETILYIEGFDDLKDGSENEQPLGAFYPFETFIVNLDGGGYLRCQLHAEFVKRDIPNRFFAKLIIIRDSIISTLSNKSREDLADKTGRDNLKSELKMIINSELRREEVEAVYFNQFVVQ